jgi:hypothetical protein
MDLSPCSLPPRQFPGPRLSPSLVTSVRAAAPSAASNRAMSRAVGAPNKRPYSRLNCEGSSYPILKPAVAASNFSRQEATSFLKAKLLLVLQRTHGGNRLEPMMKPRGGDWDVRAP